MSLVEDYLAREVAEVAQRYPSIVPDGTRSPEWAGYPRAAERAMMVSAPFLLDVHRVRGWLAGAGRRLPNSASSRMILQMVQSPSWTPRPGGVIIAAVLAGYAPVIYSVGELPHCSLQRPIDSDKLTVWGRGMAEPPELDDKTRELFTRAGWSPQPQERAASSAKA